MKTYKLNGGSHTGPDENGKERSWSTGETITTSQDLSSLGDKVTLVSETDALVNNPETPVEEEPKKKAK